MKRLKEAPRASLARSKDNQVAVEVSKKEATRASLIRAQSLAVLINFLEQVGTKMIALNLQE